MINKSKTCCFTGHRSIPSAQLESVEFYTCKTIESLAAQGYTTFISGGALGFDQLAAKIVLRLKQKYPQLSLIMALPCRNQDETWNTFQKNQYRRILERADSVICLNEKYCTGCMHQRNRFMVDNSDICIAYLTRSSGGTAYTVRYAEESGLGLVNIAHLIT